MNAKKILSAGVIALGLALLGQPAMASHQEATLGNEGELYVLHTGTYGDLFPQGTEVDKANPVLALDIVRPGVPNDRRLVSGTQDKDVEGTPAAVFEDDSNTLFVIWESRINSIHSIFRLASFDGGHWTEPLEITGNPFSVKTPPQIAVTRDSHRERASDGTSTTLHRTIVHIGWTEENGTGLYDAFYTPIILEEGVFLGTNPVYQLDTFDTMAAITVPASASAPELVRAPSLQLGRDGRTIVVAFASSTSGQMSAIEVDVLPSELQRLADKARAFIVDLGIRRKVSDLNAISTRTKTFLVDNGDDFQAEIARSISDQVGAFLLTNGGRGGAPAGPAGITNLASGARAFIVDLGAKFTDRGLKDASLASSNEAPAVPQTLEISAPPAGDGSTPATHIFQVRNASSRRSPEIGDGSVRVFASDSGDELLVSWAASDKVTYRISQGSGWSDPRVLPLSDSLDLSGAYDILAQRVRRR